MKNKSFEIRESLLDRSQGMEVKSKESIHKLYCVKEVCAFTGLSRKQLFDYKDIVKPTSYDKSGYKLYSFNDIQKLEIIAELRKIDVSLKLIRQVITNLSLKSVIINMQIENLKEQRKMIDKKIARAEEMIRADRLEKSTL